MTNLDPTHTRAEKAAAMNAEEGVLLDQADKLVKQAIDVLCKINNSTYNDARYHTLRGVIGSLGKARASIKSEKALVGVPA